MNPRFWLKLIYERDGSLCHYCRIQLQQLEDLPYYANGQLPDDYPTIDHVIAVADGGANDLDNFVAACAPCNNDKASVVGGGPRKRPRRRNRNPQDAVRAENAQRPIPRPVTPLQRAQSTNRKRWCGRCRSGWHGECQKACSCPEDDCTAYRIFNPNHRPETA